MGSTCDINNESTNVRLKRLKYFVAHRNNTNNIVVTAPRRYDLRETSCINKDIQAFNWISNAMGKLLDNMTIININPNSDDFM
jgi:hypothetical protein